MSRNILVYKISRSSVEELYPDLPDFDSITIKLPSGFYTTFRTYAERTKVIGLRAHLDRLYLPAKAQGILPVIRTQSHFREALSELLLHQTPQEARVRLIIDMSQKPGEMYVLIQELQSLPPEIYRDGVRVGLSKTSRDKPALKQTMFISESSSERKRLGGELFEVLLTHNDRILEGMTSNFFYVLDGVLNTAGQDVLAGVTRHTIIAIAKQAGISVRYEALALHEIPEIEEAFLTSSSRGVVPVVQIAAQLIGNGKVGKVTRQLMGLYERKVLELAESIL
jgi:branched-chain amino acid aminotransferase